MAEVVADEQVKIPLGWPGSDAAADGAVWEGATVICLGSFLLLCTNLKGQDDNLAPHTPSPTSPLYLQQRHSTGYFSFPQNPLAHFV